MNKVFSAAVRAERGKGPIGRLRRAGRIPAVIYGGGQPMSISLDEKEYVKEHHGLTESTIVTLKIDGRDHLVVVKDAQSDILSGKVLHVDFYEVEKGKALRVRVSIHLVGTPEGVRAGGVLENPTHFVEVECDPTILPEKIEVDVSKLQANQSIHVKDLSLDERIKVLSSPDTVIALVKYAKEEKVEAAPAAEGAAPAAEGAAAQGAAAASSTEAKAKAESKA